MIRIRGANMRHSIDLLHHPRALVAFNPGLGFLAPSSVVPALKPSYIHLVRGLDLDVNTIQERTRYRT